jgi:hypothetical protein
MSELERRVEDGVHYEHITSPINHRQHKSESSKYPQEVDIPTTRGVFVGYRTTHEEYDRLKSADPSQ